MKIKAIRCFHVWPNNDINPTFIENGVIQENHVLSMLNKLCTAPLLMRP